MKKYTLYIICLLLAVAVTSCKKEKEDSFLKGQMTEFHGQKAYIDGQNYSCFQINDQIQVNNRTCTVSGLSNSDHICTISGAEESTTGYYAFYPAGMINNVSLSGGFSNVTVTLPRVQTYREENNNQIIDNPMAGYLAPSSETTIIQFNNLCALLKVTVKSNWILDSIQVKLNGAELWGTGTVNTTYWKLVNMNNIENGASHETKHEIVSLKFPKEGISTGTTGKTFYFVVPQTTIVANSDAVTVRIFGRYKNTAVNKSFSKTVSGANVTVAYNTINTLPNVTYFEVGVGVFTVNGQGKKVAFARTNIIKSGNTFSFLADPWSNGENSNNYYYSYNNLVSYTTNWEWTVNDYPSHTWRILTTTEWIHVVRGNRGATRNSYWCKVNGKCGLIIYPDGCNLTSPANHDVDISETNWANIYESVGCIFLPTHHRFNGGNADNAAANINATEQPNYHDALGIYAMANNVCLRFQYNAESSDGYSPNFNGGAPIPSASGVTVRLVHDLN